MDKRLERIGADPRYRELVRDRSRLSWGLSLAMLASFVAYIGLIAFDKPLLAAPVGDGVTSIGIPVGLGLIVFAILLTAIYVRRANTLYDRRLAAILADHAE